LIESDYGYKYKSFFPIELKYSKKETACNPKLAIFTTFSKLKARLKDTITVGLEIDKI
jgi:hypothetical protein